MKTKKIFPLLLLLLFFNIKKSFSQNLILKITHQSKNDSILLSKINFKNRHYNYSSLRNEVISISKKLQYLGYFYNTFKLKKKKEKTHDYTFKLNEKIDSINIFNPSTKNNHKIKIENLKNFLQQTSEELNSKGKSFSEVQLKNIKILKNNLTADLHIKESYKRTINKVIIKGYEKFPKKYITHFLKINKNTVFSKKKLKNISNALNNLNFITQTSPPQTLFSKDSTQIYLYLKKKNINTINGILNFSDNQSFNIYGQLNLKLKNIFNKGESFLVKWNNLKDQSQTLEISAKNNYIFNSSISPEFTYSIYKKDSSYLNSKFSGVLRYNLSHKSSIGLSYEHENSTLSTITDSENIKSFKSLFFGIYYRYKIFNEQNNKKFEMSIHPNYGNRTTKNENQNQFKLIFNISYLHEFNKKNSIYIRNKTGHLNSQTLLTNESFRIGGYNSIRGFKEQSIFTNEYTFFNLEYQYSVSNKSKLYSITDLGKTKASSLIGIGIGYLFNTKNNTIKLEYSAGTSNYFKNSNSNIGIEIINKF